MAKVFADLIINGSFEFENVPAALKQQVKDELIARGREDLTGK